MTSALFLSIFFIPALLVQAQDSSNASKPDQVHLSFGESVDTIVVTWSTTQDARSVVEYGIGGTTKSADGYTTKFVDGGDLKTVRFIHRVHLRDLEANKQYVYRCGSESGWTGYLSFKTVKDFSTRWSPSLIFYGDMGADNARAFPFIQREVEGNEYDVILHVGDIAYDMCWENGAQGDKFMRLIEPIAAKMPYMVCPGNHEATYNFSHYRNRFSMPGQSEGLFYSFNIGPAHFISLDSEAYYYYEQLKLDNLLRNQYRWLEDDLKRATSPEERAIRPWIITYAHRPMYCSASFWMFGYMECRYWYNMIRTGVDLDGTNKYGLEDLFIKYGVDLSLWGHEHAYERSWPVYNYTVYNGSNEQPYRNPRALVHIISGSPGSREGIDGMVSNPESWSAFKNRDYGYGRLKIHNATHLHVEQVSVDHADKDGRGTIIDEMWLIREQHGSYEEAIALEALKANKQTRGIISEESNHS